MRDEGVTNHLRRCPKHKVLHIPGGHKERTHDRQATNIDLNGRLAVKVGDRSYGTFGHFGYTWKRGPDRELYTSCDRGICKAFPWAISTAAKLLSQSSGKKSQKLPNERWMIDIQFVIANTVSEPATAGPRVTGLLRSAWTSSTSRS